MSVYDATPEEEISQAAERMAVRALAVLEAVEGTDAPRPDPVGASKPDLAAARVIGADLFAPYQLAAVPLCAELEEAVALAQAFQLFSAPDPSGSGADGSTAASAVAWRDWAAAELLDRCAPDPERVVPMPDRHLVPEDDFHWQEWSGWMAQLAPLALPGLDSPVHEAAQRHARALARGTVRSMLRRDYRTAARTARWLALGHSHGVHSPVDLAPLLRHIRLFGGPSARTALDLRVGERLSQEEGL
ncbi:MULTISPECIES: hypothetical protein [Streptacidiphilus]|uniref:Uncharacterized protein n=1 Tax=Streptacidiphilus cavernicola TaxID=3342716 RepID=A0ABV6UVW0_9ACTN|nr:hypothetical protein [Streptacidiphilus jeojiense]